MTGNGYRPKLAVVLVAGLLVVVAAACGGGSSSSAPSIVSNESTTTTARESSTTTAGGSSASSDLNNSLDALGGSTGACVKIGLAYASVSLSMLGGLGAAFGGDQSQLTDAETQLQSIQADIPPELKNDFATISKTITNYTNTLKGLSGNILDPAYQQQLDDAGKTLETPEFTSAQKNVENYLDANCPK
jgi:hypothetical protein